MKALSFNNDQPNELNNVVNLSESTSMDELTDNVIDLASERELRTQQEPEELECSDGVCVVKWRPRRPAA